VRVTRRGRLVVAVAVIVAAGTAVGVLVGRDGGDRSTDRASRAARPGATTTAPASSTTTTLPASTSTTGAAAPDPAAPGPGPGAPAPAPPATPAPTAPPGPPPTGPFPITPGVPTNGLLLTEVTCRADGDELVATGRLHNLSYPSGLIDLEVTFLDAAGAEIDWDTDLFTLDPGASETFELSGLADSDTVVGLRCAFTAG